MVRYKELLLLTPILHVKDSEFRPIPGHQRESPSDFHQFYWQVEVEWDGALDSRPLSEHVMLLRLLQCFDDSSCCCSSMLLRKCNCCCWSFGKSKCVIFSNSAPKCWFLNFSIFFLTQLLPKCMWICAQNHSPTFSLSFNPFVPGRGRNPSPTA